MTRENKKGSALLIVLGFLSFMVVSAVAFAIFMRNERQPSSAVRRAIATRHLVKAALAEAISRVDDAVRDDPFPGMCVTNASGGAGQYTYIFGNGLHAPVDYWEGRIFMPPDPLGGGTEVVNTRRASASETVSVVNLEGLGYVPPPLVNDVRFLSRGSYAASWQPLPYDSGRFAYCAVNVSDFFDVNAVASVKPRTAEPNRIISLAHAFDPNFKAEDVRFDNNTSISGSSMGNPNTAEAAAFDKFTGKDTTPFTTYVAGDSIGGDENFSPIGATSPYVSMMDYNLALNVGGATSIMKPLYYEWIAGKRDGSYYNYGSQESAAAARQPFVTESCATNEQYDVDISTVEGQPFKGMKSQLQQKNGKYSYTQMIKQAEKNEFIKRMRDDAKLIGYADIATLWDYLDHDDVPLSLAIPCVEQVPMICGLSSPLIQIGGSFTAGEPDTTKNDDEGKETETPVTFNPAEWFKDGDGDIRVTVAYPFKRGSYRADSSKFKVQLMLRVAFAPPDANRISLADIVKPTKEDWEKISKRMDNNENFLFTFVSKFKGVNLPNDITDESQACITGGDSGKGTISFQFGDFGNDQLSGASDEQKMILKIIEKQKKQKATDGTITLSPAQTFYRVTKSPFASDGSAFFPINQELQDSALNASQAFVPHTFIWARIVNNNDVTVDLVPACLADDEDIRGHSVRGNRDYEDFMSLSGGFDTRLKPVFHFAPENEDSGFTFAPIKAKSPLTANAANWRRKGIYAADPKFNHAPQLWFDAETENIDFDKWLSKVHNEMKNRDYCDQDIFSFASNQGFLQSIGEFSFLPYLHEPGSQNLYIPFTAINENHELDVSDTINDVFNTFKYVWRTYDASDFYKLAPNGKIGISKSGASLVNPHTDNPTVMMAALANTPVDYWATAQGIVVNDNDVCKQLGNPKINSDGFDTFKDAKDYAFNGVTQGSKITYPQWIDIAKKIMSSMAGVNNPDRVQQIKAKIRNDGYKPSNVWTWAWDELWNSEVFDVVEAGDQNSFKNFLGTDTQDPLHTIDRKFLYSYWRECFANTQQLFLIFVRAESSALGGPGEGTPGQLGGRAVALVWRDPDWSEGNGENGRDRDIDDDNEQDTARDRSRPHRTRILFYHQFD